MIADKLRKSILQAAIQGKLTEQLPKDGDARDLLEEIKTEKTQLIKEGKIKKEKLLLEITEDEVMLDIPDNWCWVRLEQITSILGDGIHGTPEYDLSGEYNFINGNNLNNGKLDIKDETKRVNDVEYKKYKKVLDDTTVLVSINGTIGNVAFYNHEKVVLGKSACYFNLLGGILRDYIKILISTDYFFKYAIGNATGSTIKNVSLQVMRYFLVPLPPIAEQLRIVVAVNESLVKIKELKKDELKLDLIQKSFPKKMKDSLLQAAIQGKLTEQLTSDGDARDLVADIQKEKHRLINEGKIKKEKELPEIMEDEIPFDIPENWCWVRLGDIGETNIGLTYKPSDVSDNGTLVLRSGNIQNNKMDYNDNLYVSCNISDSKKCHVGDILICARNGSKRLVGKAALIDHEGMTFGAFMALYRSPFNEYIHRYLSSPYFRSDLDGVSTTTINQITQNNLKERLIPLPPLAEQQRIVERLEQLLPLCDTLE